MGPWPPHPHAPTHAPHGHAQWPPSYLLYLLVCQWLPLGLLIAATTSNAPDNDTNWRSFDISHTQGTSVSVKVEASLYTYRSEIHQANAAGNVKSVIKAGMYKGSDNSWCSSRVVDAYGDECCDSVKTTQELAVASVCTLAVFALILSGLIIATGKKIHRGWFVLSGIAGIAACALYGHLLDLYSRKFDTGLCGYKDQTIKVSSVKFGSSYHTAIAGVVLGILGSVLILFSRHEK